MEIDATRWTAAGGHLAAAARLMAASPDPALTAEATVLEAEVALAGGDLVRARGLARAALDSGGAAPEVRCHALEITGRSERMRDLAVARAAFERALAIADAAGLPIWRLRALHELGTIELFDHVGTGRLTEARRTAAELGALSTAAVLDLQLAAAGHSLFELDEAVRHARDCLAISERLGLPEVRAKALLFLAENAALRGDRDRAEHFIPLALAAADGDSAIEAFCWGARGMLAVLADDSGAALAALGRAAVIFRDCPGAEPAGPRPSSAGHPQLVGGYPGHQERYDRQDSQISGPAHGTGGTGTGMEPASPSGRQAHRRAISPGPVRGDSRPDAAIACPRPGHTITGGSVWRLRSKPP